MAKIRKTEGTSHVNDKDACKDGEGRRGTAGARKVGRDNDGEGRRGEEGGEGRRGEGRRGRGRWGGTTMARGEDGGKGKMKGEVPIMTPLPYSSRGRFSE